MGKKKPLPQIELAHKALDLHCNMKDLCTMCGKKITTQIYKGSGVCSENCRKDRDDDHEPFRGGRLAP